MPLWLAVYAIFLPESPRWLCVQFRDEDAGRALRKIRGASTTPEFVAVELEAIKESIRLEREVQTGVSFFDIFRGTDLVRMLSWTPELI